MRQEGDSPDREIATLAAAQHGVVSQAQLRAAGLSTSAIARRVKVGRLHRIHRGVYAVGHSGLAREGTWMAAILACGRGSAGGSLLSRWGAALSHRSAACLWGLLARRDDPVDVSVPSEAGKRLRRGICLHRCASLDPGSVTLRKRIPVTTPARTIADLRRLAARRPDVLSRGEVRRAVRQAEVLGLPSEALNRDRTRSELERDFLRVCRRHGVPAPEVNVRVGRHLVDFLWRDRRLIVETDGYRYHRGRQAFEDDRARDLELRAMGFEVVRLSYRQVDEDPSGLAGILRGMLASPLHRVGRDGG